MKLVFATNNQHKLEELRQIVGPGHQILGLSDIGCNADIPETGSTLQENALQKAMYVYQNYGYDCFADDTGLEVDALGGEPGIYSARYAQVCGGIGSGHDSKANMALLLKKLEGKENRKARFRTVIALVKGGEPRFFEGIVEGEILTEPHGEGGFGYDPVFRPEGWSKTFAEAAPSEKNAVSHRGRATNKLINYLSNA
ncbi:MAG: non-canonical purine NTP diphosphatase [Bacteroidales bacterium]|nr:non-canonical purine NTP diphosphatase [Bacteroidales bacterium]